MLKLALLLCPAVAAAAPCEKADATVWNAIATDSGVHACFQDGASCWRFDGVAWTPTTEKTPPPPDGGPHGGFAAVTEKSADGTRTAHLDDKDGKVDLVDAATGKPIARISLWETRMPGNGFGQLGFLENQLVVWESYSPVSSRAHLFDGRTGKLLAKLGRGELDEGGGLDLGKGQWLFAQFEGEELYTYDLHSGKKLATIALASPRVHEVGGASGDALLAKVDGRFFAMQGAADSGAAVYDLAKHTSRRVPLPLCK